MPLTISDIERGFRAPSKRVLFIGGTKDGELRDVPTELYEIEVQVMTCASRDDVETMGMTVIRTERYRSVPFMGGSYQVEVFAPSDWSPEDVLRSLIQNYRGRS